MRFFNILTNCMNYKMECNTASFGDFLFRTPQKQLSFKAGLLTGKMKAVVFCINNVILS